MQLDVLTITTDASGDGSGVSKVFNGNLKKIRYSKTDYADGVDFTLKDTLTGETLLTGTDVNATASYRLAEDVVDEAGAARLYAGSGEAVSAEIPVVGSLTVTVSSGGNVKTGTFYIWVG